MKILRASWYVLVFALAVYGSGVIPAIIPALVPAASRQGSSTGKFQIATGSAPGAGNCATWDGSQNLIDSGIATCGGAGTSVNSFNTRTGAVTSVASDYAALISLADTIANRPAAGTAGRLFFPSDSWYSHLRDTGAAWTYYFGGRAVTPPVNASFSWVNQGSATVTAQTNGAITMDVPAAPGDSLHFYYLATPGTPYTRVWRVQNTILTGTASSSFSGVCFQETSSGKFICLYVGNAQNAAINVARWTNSTTFDVNSSFNSIGMVGLVGAPCITYRLGDTGTNLTFEYSGDNGGSWINLLTQSRSAYFTTGPDRIGIAIDPNSSTITASQTLLSVD